MNGTNTVWLKRLVIAAVGGGIGGAFIFWIVDDPSVLKWIVLGVVCGAVIGVFWPIGHSFVIRLRVDDWRLEEVEIQGLKFKSAGVQRRVAWQLFVEITTRIAAQPMNEEEGDNGVALKSLYDLFQLTRKAISEMEPTPVASGDTVETFALDMLNSDLRPFLSRWHPIWEAFAKDEKAVSRAWPEHKQFREGLRELQDKIQGRARGLAQIAGVRNVDRFFPRRTV